VAMTFSAPKTAKRISDGIYEVGAGAWTFEAK